MLNAGGYQPPLGAASPRFLAEKAPRIATGVRSRRSVPGVVRSISQPRAVRRPCGLTRMRERHHSQRKVRAAVPAWAIWGIDVVPRLRHPQDLISLNHSILGRLQGFSLSARLFICTKAEREKPIRFGGLRPAPDSPWAAVGHQASLAVFVGGITSPSLDGCTANRLRTRWRRWPTAPTGGMLPRQTEVGFSSKLACGIRTMTGQRFASSC